MGRQKILVIDEDKASGSLFGQALEPRGTDVYVMDTPDKGIEKAIEVEPDLIFLNLIFQESNGLKVSKLIHAVEKLSAVPIVMLIAHKSDLDPKYTSTIGVVDVLIKPLSPEGIVGMTAKILGETSSTATAKIPPAEIDVEDELQMMLEDDLKPEGVSAMAFTEDTDFAGEADKLLEQAILKPGTEKKNMFELDDDHERDDVINIRKAETPEPGQKDLSDYKTDEEIEMAEGNLFDEDDRKENTPHSSFEDEFEKSEKTDLPKYDLAEDPDILDEDSGEHEKPNTLKKVLIAAGGILLIAGLGLGAYQAKKIFFKDETVKVPPKKQVVAETLPPAGQPIKPETGQPATAAPAPNDKVLPPAAEAPKKEPAAALPAAAVAPKEPEKPKAASPLNDEKQAPAAARVSEKPKAEPPAKAAPKQEPKAAAKETKKETAAQKAEKAPKGKDGSGFALQAGYFESEKNAVSLAEKLKQKGYEAYVVKNDVTVKGEVKTFHRVLIGSFDSGKKAAAYAREFKEKENVTAVIHRK